MLADVHLPPNPKGFIVFLHGYKGFKDWGCWNLVARRFAEAGFGFFKANFSGNGTTPEAPEDFADLDAFAQNTYTKEVFDAQVMLDFVVAQRMEWQAALAPVAIIGHSRGGGIATLLAAKNEAVDALITWAGVSDFSSRFLQGEPMEQWKRDQVYYVRNARTGQELPHSIDWYDDFVANASALNIQTAVERFDRPMLIVHANNDEAVHVSEAISLHTWARHSELLRLDVGGHTFGAKHPWKEAALPAALNTVCEATLAFLEKQKRATT